MNRPPTAPNNPGKANPIDESWRELGISLGLVVMTFMVFGQTLGYDFIAYDDNDYVYDNAVVAHGLTVQGFIWAFTGAHASNWHPLTWLSHMLDCQLYGLHAWGHHLTNVFLHAAAVVALFLVARKLTGALWRSALVAAVFAVHPLRAESVAWVAERKDVLSGLFFMLTIGAYAGYVRHRPSIGRYGLVLLLFALGLMCKPMLVTIPVILLLLDYWPLRRPESLGKLIREKLPLVGLAAVSCLVTLVAQRGTIQSTASFSLSLRLANALATCLIYLWQMICPRGLAPFYPYTHDGMLGFEAALAGLLLLGFTALVVCARRGQPWLLVGWLWYLVMLLPVIGIIQVGDQSHADRYTYLPQIGIYIALTWQGAKWCGLWRRGEVFGGSVMAVLLMALMACARKQVAYWQNDETLWTHTLACTKQNAVAHNNYGTVLMRKGKVDDAISQYRIALELNPASAEWRYNLGVTLLQIGRVDEAIACFRAALQNKPNDAKMHNNLGFALREKGADEEALVQFRQALQIDPNDPRIQNNLAFLLATSSRPSLRDGAKALELAQAANELTGGVNPVVLGTLAAALAETGRFSEAAETAQRALDLADGQSQKEIAGQLQAQLKHYQAGKPFYGTLQTH